MRSLTFLGTVAAIATLGYLYVPKIIDSFKPDAGAPPADQATVTDGRASSGSMRPPPPGYRPGEVAPAGAAATAMRKPRGKKPAAPESGGLSPQVDEAALAAETGLRPVEADALPPEQAPEAMANGPENHIKERWINDLSGQQARLTMGKNSQDLGCAEEYSHCERPPTPKDAIIAGVVVKTDPLQPFAGKVVRGNYLNQTPGVYLK